MNKLNKTLGNLLLLTGLVLILYGAYKSYFYYFSGEKDFYLPVLILSGISLIYFLPGFFLKKKDTSKSLAWVIFLIPMLMIIIHLTLGVPQDAILPPVALYGTPILIVYFMFFITLLLTKTRKN